MRFGRWAINYTDPSRSALWRQTVSPRLTPAQGTSGWTTRTLGGCRALGCCLLCFVPYGGVVWDGPYVAISLSRGTVPPPFPHVSPRPAPPTSHPTPPCSPGTKTPTRPGPSRPPPSWYLSHTPFKGECFPSLLVDRLRNRGDSALTIVFWWCILI